MIYHQFENAFQDKAVVNPESLETELLCAHYALAQAVLRSLIPKDTQNF